MQTAYRYRHGWDLLTELVIRDLKLRYHRSFIGLGWSLMKPLTQLAVFTIVFGQILPLGIEHYATFVFTGVLVWSWLSSSVTSGTGAVTDSKELALRPGFPLPLLPVMPVISQGVHFLIALPLLVISATIEAGFPGWPLLALPAMIILQLIFTLGVVYLLSVAQVFARDTDHLVQMAMSIIFFITPIFYRPIQRTRDFAFLNVYNPIARLLEGYRAIFVHGTWPNPITLGFTLLIAVPLLALGIACYLRASRRFDEAL
ncbi:MAG: ABC transporter [Proteobacteria bacterium SG_bin6]|nr:MAG: ABC transporter [Proteobacteria bacterium SG_bin6]